MKCCKCEKNAIVIFRGMSLCKKDFEVVKKRYNEEQKEIRRINKVIHTPTKLTLKHIINPFWD